MKISLERIWKSFRETQLKLAEANVKNLVRATNYFKLHTSKSARREAPSILFSEPELCIELLTVYEVPITMST